MADFVYKCISGHPENVKIGHSGPWKWGKIFEKLPDMRVIFNPSEDTKSGWEGFVVEDKKVAAAAATSVSSHCDRILKCRDHGWRIQSAVRDHNGVSSQKSVLWIRKISTR